jgi:hypothetical protein
LSPPSLLVTNLVFMDITLRQRSNHLSEKLQIHSDSRMHDEFKTMSNQCWFGHFTLKALCIWTGEIGCSEASERKRPGQTSSLMAQQFLGPATPTCHSLCCSFWQSWVIPHHPYSLDLLLKTKLKLKRWCFGSTDEI